MRDVSIIIVSWNVRERLRACLLSIFKSVNAPTFEVVVVDNASHDGSGDMVATEFPHVTLLRNDENVGCSRAVNRGIRMTQSRLVLWLNPDMQLFPSTLQNLVAYADAQPHAAVIGAKLVNDEGGLVPHIRKFPTVIDQFFIISKIAKLFPRILDSYLCRTFDYSKEASVDSIRGSFFCMRSDVIEKIGMLDERFFIWFEEVDFCKRVIDAGYEVRYTPSVSAIDYVGQSFAQVPTIKKQKMFITSMMKYFLKHGVVSFPRKGESREK